MTWTMGLVLIAGAAMGAAACGPALAPGAGAPEAQMFSRPGAGVTVLSATQLGTAGGSLLDALRGRIASLRVERNRGPCPSVALRGVRSMTGTSSPSVYVDGTPAANTCILELLRADDVARVEVNTGVTARPGYRPNSHGMILVFMRTHAGS